MTKAEQVFDYIVVGAGSAGCAIAARLSEDPNVQVLLLEAGGRDWSPFIHMPVGYSRVFQTRDDWNYMTEPQTELQGRQLYWPRGKVLGGSSSINAMVYMRGARLDYDRWAELGNQGWSFADVLPYFIRSEDNQRGASTYHGAGGPQTVSDVQEPHPWSLRFLDACSTAGFAKNADFNGASQDGAGMYQVTQRGAQRCSTAVAYLRPAEKRANLTLLTGALTTKVVLRGNRCIGIEYRRRGKLQRARAEAEVILAGGTVNSPQLLMLSGIGPADHLRSVGVDVTFDLPGVGEGLQDHPIMHCVFRSHKPESILAAESVKHIGNYFLFRRGMCTSSIAEAALFARSTESLLAPDLQVNFAPAPFVNHGLQRIHFHGMTLGIILNEVASRGRIRLRSNNPSDAPAIDPRYFTEPVDATKLLRGIEYVRSVVAQRPLADIISGELTPGPTKTTRSELLDALKQQIQTIYHPVSSCRMGTDADAVVDPKLRVRGIQGLRVADASVMPTHIHGNTNAPTIMIAERAVDMILGRTLERSDVAAPMPASARVAPAASVSAN